jgi:hypothetical protein
MECTVPGFKHVGAAIWCACAFNVRSPVAQQQQQQKQQQQRTYAHCQAADEGRLTPDVRLDQVSASVEAK